MNSNAQIAILAAGGAAVYFATRDKGPVTGTPTGSTTPSRPRNFKSMEAVKRGLTQSVMQKLGQVSNPSTKSGSNVSGYPKEIEDQIKKDLKRQWDMATDQAKVEICKRLKKQFPKDAGIQAMNCDKAASMEFQAVLNIVGAAAGMAICGPPCSVVGALVAAYAGPKLEEWAKDAWGEVKDGAEKGGKWVADKIGDAMPWNW